MLCQRYGESFIRFCEACLGAIVGPTYGSRNYIKLYMPHFLLPYYAIGTETVTRDFCAPRIKGN